MRNFIGLILAVLLALPLAAGQAMGAHSATLTWTPPSDGSANPSSGYNVLKGTTAGGENATPINSAPVAVGCASTTNCTYTDTNVQAGQTYYYKVEFVVGTTLSAPSPEASGTVPVSPPTGLTLVTN